MTDAELVDACRRLKLPWVMWNTEDFRAGLRRLIAEAVEKEREECANVCLAIEDEPIPTAEAADADVAYGMGRSSGAERCAHAIRARSKEAGNG